MYRLVLIPDYDHHSGEEFESIVARIKSMEPSWKVELLDLSALRWRARWMRKRPTLFVSWKNIKWRPKRGCLLHGQALKKSEQFAILENAGFDVPKFTAIGPDTKLSEDEWGPVVVVKPEAGARGKQVRIRKPKRVKWVEGEEMVAQEFIYTGKQPTSFRVQTLCGEVMYAFRSVNEGCGSSLEDCADSSAFGGHNIVASAREAKMTLIEDREILEFGARVAREAFPELPLLGLDILRDVRTGQLAVAEVNPWGHTWHISSQLGKSLQEFNGFNLEEQFGLSEVAAQALVAAVNRWARP